MNGNASYVGQYIALQIRSTFRMNHPVSPYFPSTLVTSVLRFTTTARCYEEGKSSRVTSHATCHVLSRPSSDSSHPASPRIRHVSKDRWNRSTLDRLTVWVMENKPRDSRSYPMELQINLPVPPYEFICRLCTRCTQREEKKDRKQIGNVFRE